MARHNRASGRSAYSVGGESHHQGFVRTKSRRDARISRLRIETLEDRCLLAIWQEFGPNPILDGQTPGFEDVAGRLVSIAPHPTDVNTIYVAGAHGGVWKTTDGGQSWNPLTDGQATLAMGSIAVAPSNPNIVYAGTGEAHFSADSMYGRGVLKSTDAGNTWTLLGQTAFNRRAIADVLVHPTDLNTVYVAVGRAAVNGLSGNDGVWKTTDGGANWSNTSASISTTVSVTDLVMDPTNPNVLVAAYGEIYGSSVNGLYRTTNGGASWSPIGGGVLPSGSSAGRAELAISADGQTVYAGWTAPNTWGLQGFFQSIDGGTNWTNRTTTTPNFLGAQGWYDHVLIVDPANPNRVYAGGASGTNSLIRSDNGGASWTAISVGTNGIGPHVDQHAFAFDADGRLLNGNDGGIWRTDNMGSTWINRNSNLGITQFYDIALHPTDPNIAYGGTQDNGTAKYLGVPEWDHIFGGDGGVAQVDFNNPNTIYIETQYNAAFLRRSDNAGVSFVSKTSGINTSDSGRFIIPYEMDPSNPQRLVLGTNRVYETTNRADSWAPISAVLSGGVIASLEIAPSDPNTIYVSYTDGTVHATTNGGSSWQLRDGNLPEPPPGLPFYSGKNFGELRGAELIPEGLPGTAGVGDFAIDPANAATVYLVRDEFGLGKVWKTINGGQTWTNITGNLPDVPAQDIVLDPRTTPDTIYVSMDSGVYTSADQGGTWVQFGVGLPNSVGNDLEINLVTNTLNVGTHGRGMWRISLDQPELFVVSTVPAAGATVSNVPVDYVVNFSDNIDVTTVNAGDFLVTDDSNTPRPADSFVVNSSAQVTFHFNSPPFTTQGLHEMVMAAASVLRFGDGAPLAALSVSFRYDATVLAVTSTDPPVGGAFAPQPGPLLYSVHFNEPVATASVQTTDLVLSGIAGVSVIGVTVLPGGTTAQFTISGVTTEGTLTANIAAAAITDVFGNPGLAFSASYQVDVGTVAYPVPLTAKAPPGSLIYDPTAPGAITFAGDIDTFTLAVDPGQTITLLVSATSIGLRPSIELLDPSGASLGTATAAIAGDNALLQTVAAASAAAGSYQMIVSGSNSTTGNYTLQVILNAAQENEGVLAGASNDTLATAQDINGSFITLSTTQASAQRGAVLGATELETNFDYTAAAVAPTFVDISATGNISTAIADDASQALSEAQLDGFVFPFFGANYTGIGFSTNGLITFPAGNSIYTNTDLSASPPEGSIAALWDDLFNPNTGAGPASSRIYWQVVGSGATQQLIIQWNNVRRLSGTALFTFQAVLSANGEIQLNYGAEVTTANVVATATIGIKAPGQSNPDRLLIGFNQPQGPLVGPNLSTRISPATAAPDVYSFTLAAGEIATLALTGLAAGNLGMELRDAGNAILATAVGGSTNLSQVISNFVAVAAGTYYAWITDDIGVPYTLVVTRRAAFDTEPNDSFGAAQNLGSTANVLAVLGAITGSDEDWFTIVVTDTSIPLRLETSTPADGDNELLNDLNPRIELFDPSGAFVGSGLALPDGRNEFLEHLPLVTGNYRLRVTDEINTVGEYFVTVTKVAPTADAGGPYSVNEGSAVMLTGSGSSGGPAPLSFHWDLDGDGVFDETGAAAERGDENVQNPTFSAAGLDGPSSLIVSLYVTNAGGTSPTVAATVNILNVAPTVDAGGPYNVVAGTTVLLTGSATDPAGPLDTLNYAWDLDGDGSFGESGLNAARGDENVQNPTFSAVGLVGPSSVMVALRVTDDDGGASVDVTATVDVLFSGPPSGPEFRVNTFTTGSQSDSSVAMDADGDFVAAWSSYQDGSAWGVYAQRYNAAGEPQGSEFRVNTFTDHNQKIPSVAMDADGDFVIAWNSFGQDGSGVGIYAQRYDAAGVPQGGEFQVNTFTAGDQAGPSVAMDSDGDFVIVWQSDEESGLSSDVYVRLFNSAGVPQGSEFRVNTFTNDYQFRPKLAINTDGNFVITWQSVQDGSSDGVYAQRYNATGQPEGGEFRVNSFTTGAQSVCSAAMDADGDFVIAWESFSQDGAGYGVYAQRYNVAGVPLGGEFRVNTVTSDNQHAPSVAIDADGDFVIAWYSYGQDGSGDGIYAQRYDATGQPEGGEFRVNTFTNSAQRFPSAAMDSDGDFVITWASYGQDGSGSGIYARLFTSLTANSGGPYSVVAGASVVMDRAYANPPGAYTYSWDLDNDGAFGETGPGALRGDEVGLTPTFNATGLIAPSSVPVTFRVNNGWTNVDSATTVDIIAALPVLIIDNGDPAGFALAGEWAPGGGQDVGRNNSVYVTFGESFLPTDVATWTFNVGGPGRYRVSATWFTNTGFPHLFAGAARYEVSDPGASTVRGTALMNLKLFPDDFTDAGSPWEDLGAFDISGSTLVVKLLSTADDQTYVVADAIRIEKVADLSPAAEIHVVDNGLPGQNGANVPDDTGSVAFGTAEFNEPLQRTFTISNSGTQPLDLTGAVTVTGTVFAVVTPPALTTLNPGQSTTFTIQMNAATPGAHTATVSFANDDGNEDPFDFTVSGTVLPTRIVDDLDPGYSNQNVWGSLAGYGYKSLYHYSRLFTGADISTWVFNVTPGQYRVSATWFTDSPTFDNTAPFTVFDGAASRGGKDLNQQLAPDDRFADGSAFEDIGVFNILGDTLAVQLRGDDPVLFVLADAILIERLGDVPPGPEIAVLDGDRDVNAGAVGFGTVELNHPLSKTFTITNSGTSALDLLGAVNVPAGYTVTTPPALSTLNPGETTTFTVRLDAVLPGTYAGQISIANNDGDEDPLMFDIAGTVLATQILDDGQPGYQHTGAFQSASAPAARDGDVSYAYFQAAASVATWTFTVTPGQYWIAATWFDAGGNAAFSSNSPFTILDGGTPVGTVPIDQRFGPNDLMVDGSSWEYLGAPVNIFSSTLTVRLTNVGADGYVLADAIRIERLGDTNGNVEPGGGLPAGSSATSLQFIPVTGGPFRLDRPKRDALDAALATSYWNDELDEVAIVLADDQSADEVSEPATELPTANESNHPEAIDLALTDWV